MLHALPNKHDAKRPWCATLLDNALNYLSVGTGVGEYRSRWQTADDGAGAGLVRGQHDDVDRCLGPGHPKRPRGMSHVVLYVILLAVCHTKHVYSYVMVWSWLVRVAWWCMLASVAVEKFRLFVGHCLGVLSVFVLEI